MFTITNPQGYVVNVIFNVSGTDGTYSTSLEGNITFNPEQDEVGFVPYEQLTQDEVIGWINIATNNLENYYASINGQINALANPPVPPANTPLPWSA